MKKLVAFILAVTMVATLGLTAFAAETETPITGSGATETAQTGTADVYTTTTEADEWWVVQIPADGQIAWGQEATVNMGYKVASQLKEGAKVKVTVTAGSTTLDQDGSGTATIAYTGTGLGADSAKEYNAANGKGVNATSVSEWNDQTSAVTIAVTADAFQGKPIDKYSVTLTYSVEVIEAAQITE